MTKIPETAQDRRVREAQEARIATAKWNEQKHLRLLRAMALANQLYVNAQVCLENDQLCYQFALSGFERFELVDSLEEWNMIAIEEELERRQIAEQHKARLKEVKADLMRTLTEEQKEALGLI